MLDNSSHASGESNCRRRTVERGAWQEGAKMTKNSRPLLLVFTASVLLSLSSSAQGTSTLTELSVVFYDICVAMLSCGHAAVHCVCVFTCVSRRDRDLHSTGIEWLRDLLNSLVLL